VLTDPKDIAAAVHLKMQTWIPADDCSYVAVQIGILRAAWCRRSPTPRPFPGGRWTATVVNDARAGAVVSGHSRKDGAPTGGRASLAGVRLGRGRPLADERGRDGGLRSVVPGGPGSSPAAALPSTIVGWREQPCRPGTP
jgi:hypothetical protein